MTAAVFADLEHISFTSTTRASRLIDPWLSSNPTDTGPSSYDDRISFSVRIPQKLDHNKVYNIAIAHAQQLLFRRAGSIEGVS
jgi:hypothetical protein